MRTLIHCSLALALGLAAALLVSSCGGSGKGLIPLANAGPLQSDFEAVANAAREGNGNCAATSRALEQTQRDFQRLPGSVNAALRNRLSEGITNLRDRALALCEQPLATTSTPTTTTTQTTPTTTTGTQTTPTTTTQTTPTTTTNTQPTTPAQGGGTQGPGEGSQGNGGTEEPQGGGPGPQPGASGGTGQGAGQ
ncbi:MAG TPA: hypothetical protein VIC05_05195 [Solirubrobacteraceae bacterium]